MEYTKNMNKNNIHKNKNRMKEHPEYEWKRCVVLKSTIDKETNELYWWFSYQKKSSKGTIKTRELH